MNMAKWWEKRKKGSKWLHFLVAAAAQTFLSAPRQETC